MIKFFQVTQDKPNNRYTISMSIPSDQSSKPEIRGYFIVVVKGVPTNYINDTKLPMFERYQIKVTDCSNGQIDVSPLNGL